MGLPCMNCQKELGSDEGKLFAQCFVCPDCYAMATRIVEQGEQELRYLMTTLKELVRLSIIRGELSFSPPKEEAPSPRTNVVDALADLVRKQKEGIECPTPQPRNTKKRSKAITKRPVVTVDGSVSSDSTPAQDSASETPSTQTPATEPSDNARSANGEP